MNNELKSKIISFVSDLGIPVAGVSGDGKTYSNIVCLFPYYTGAFENANVSRYTFGRDYHIICAEYLEKIRSYILSLVPNARIELHVDKGEGNDKEEAYRAGLGFYGKNSLLINPTFGSFVFIGFLKTDLVLPPDKPLNLTCQNCNKCVSACPGKAIRCGKILQEKCASFLSQKKGELSDEEKIILIKTGLIWGCDTCQTVCPHNQDIPLSPIADFYESQIHKISSLNLSNSEFKKVYGDRAFAWRGRNVLLRNLDIISMHDSEKRG